MNVIPPKFLLLLSISLLAFAGCVDLKVLDPKADSARFYRFDSVATPADAPAGALTILVGPSLLAGYLDQPKIVTLDSPNEVSYSNSHRWAEPLEDGINRILAGQLAAGLATQRVGMQASMGALPWDYRIGYEVQQLGGPLDGPVRLEVLWWIDSKGGETREFIHTSLEQPLDAAPGDYPAYVRALQALLQQWASEAAQRVQSAQART